MRIQSVFKEPLQLQNLCRLYVSWRSRDKLSQGHQIQLQRCASHTTTGYCITLFSEFNLAVGVLIVIKVTAEFGVKNEYPIATAMRDPWAPQVFYSCSVVNYAALFWKISYENLQ